MTFARVKPDDWAVNEEIASASLNQLDIDHAKAVDKTGDTFTGALVMATGSSVTYQTGSTATFASGSFLTVQTGGSVTLTTAGLTIGGSSVFTIGGSVTTAFNGAVDFNGAITFDGTTAFGANMTLNNSASMTVANVSSTVFTYVSNCSEAGMIQSSTAMIVVVVALWKNPTSTMMRQSLGKPIASSRDTL